MARAKARQQTGTDLFGDFDDDPDDLLDAPPDAPAAKVKGKLRADLTCSTCGRRYMTTYLISKGLPPERCCGRLYCHAVQTWSDEEWRLRAESVLLRPPLRPFTRLRVDATSECAHPSAPCGKPMATVALPPGMDVPQRGRGDRAMVCTGCGWVGRVWTAMATDSDRLDAEALRRCPGADPARRFGPDTSPGHPGCFTQPRQPAPAPVVAPEPIAAPETATEPVLEPPRANLLDVLPTTSASRQPAPKRAPARAVAVGHVCQVVDQKGREFKAKCGRTVIATNLREAGMAAFGVTCPACLGR